MEASTQKHVAVFVFPFNSHPYTLLLLTRRLAAASPPTTIFSFFSTGKSNAALFGVGNSDSGENFTNIRPFTVHDGLPEGYAPAYDPRRVAVQLDPVGRFMKAASESFRAAVVAAEAAVGCKISCVVSAAFLWFVGELTTEMAVPWVVVNTCAPRHLAVAMDVDLIRATVGTTSESKEKTLDFIPGFSTTRSKELPEGISWGNLDSPFSHMLQKMGHTLHKSTAMVINSFEEIDPVTAEYLDSKFNCCLHIGLSGLAIPPPFKDDYGCIPWLDGHGPGSVVYLSFGTFLTLPNDELVAIVEALREVGCPFLWSFKGTYPKENLPRDVIDYVEEKGKFVPWAPQLAILGHGSVGVLVMHCGTNTLIESIVGGVPVIARPFFGGQPLNRAVVEDVWRTGVVVEAGRFTKDGLVKGLRLVLFGEEGKCMRARVCALKESALKSMEPNGSSSRNFNSLVEIINK